MTPIYRYSTVFALLVVALAFAYWHGSSSATAECKADELQQTVKAQADRIAELETTAKLSKSAAQDAADRIKQLEKDKSDAAKKSDPITAGLRAGSVRVRDRFTCPAKQDPRPSTSAGDTAEAHTGFGATDAIAALAIAHDGDNAIRELNTCIEQMHEDRRLLGQEPG